MKIDEAELQEPATEVGFPDSGKPPRTGMVRKVVVAIVALAAVAFVVTSGILPRVRARQAVRVETDELAVPSVTVARLQPSTAQQEVVLPANIQPYISAPIFARTNGYLKKWHFDIGAHVKQGSLLAEIETPEVDAQLRQARADLATAQANLHLSEITAARYQELLKSDSVSKQDTDNATNNLAAQRTTVQSNEQNVRRLEDLVSFEKVYAPFDGVITARNTDVGNLINSGAGSPTAQLFQMSAIDTLRVYVSVPQIYSPAARVGLLVDLTLPQYPGRRFVGKLVRTAEAIDPASRTLLVEIDVKNSTAELLPGAYAEAHFKLPSSARTYLLPVPALIFRSEGLQVATVNDGHHAELRRIQLGRDFGTQVEVIDGLNPEDEVIINPPDSLVSGEEVRPVTQSYEGAEPAEGGQQEGSGGGQRSKGGQQ
jgi:RND family efflux transporter MFP subunit